MCLPLWVPHPHTNTTCSNWSLGWEKYDAAQFDSCSSIRRRKSDRYHPYSSTSRPQNPSSSDSESSASESEDDDADFEATTTLSSRRKEKGHIPRPRNAFIIFRSDFCKKSRERNNRQISQIAGVLWGNMSEEQKQPYRLQAAKALADHKAKYPDYKFSPVAKGGTERRRGKEGARAEARRCRAIALLMVDGIDGKELEEMKKLMDRDGNIPGINAPSSAAPTRSRQRNSRSQGSARKQERRSKSANSREPSIPPIAPSPPVETPELSPTSPERSLPTPTPSPLLTPVQTSAPELPIATCDQNEIGALRSDPHADVEASYVIASKRAPEANMDESDMEPSLNPTIVPDDEVCAIFKPEFAHADGCLLGYVPLP